MKNHCCAGPGHVEGSKPHLVGFTCALCPEELLAPVQPSERVISAFEHGERQLVVSWHGGTFVVIVLGALWNSDDVWNGRGEGECGKGMD
jgi:hypothetical protein